MESYLLTPKELFKKYSASESGLTAEEAALRLKNAGRNELNVQKKKSVIALFFAQFKDLMSIILICAALLSAVLAYLTHDKSELADTGILLFVIFLNAVVGFLQQHRADSALEKLKKLSVSTAKAVRSGRLIVIDAAELVPGDMIELEEGDRVPADCRILTGDNVRADESALTGESRPVIKQEGTLKKLPLAERSNMLYSSTFVVSGRARCLVTETGMNTEMGAISRLLSESKPMPSPLDKAVTKLGKLITAVVLIVAALLFITSIFAQNSSFLEAVMTAIAVAVAAIPEGMGAVVTIILAVGIQRMSKEKAVMRKLNAVETLGSCSCICSDKTGTLTKNKMTVWDIAAFGYGARERMLTCMRVCNTVKGGEGGYIGDPTEIALLEYAGRGEQMFTVLGGMPFTSERKRMSVAIRTPAGDKLYVKGGADVLLKRCKSLYSPEGLRPLTHSDRREIEQKISAYSQEAMRVLAFAEGEYAGKEREEELTFLGLAALYDPPKDGTKEAVAACRSAGIKTVMITGDSAETAFEIARRLGISNRKSEVISGDELDGMSEEAFISRVKQYSVYARVSPKHKLNIVRALQKSGEVVAMTGDGVNDSPSVKAADIGVAMGSGTDVTKNAADMVLSDDNFSTMVKAVEEGRNVFYNVKRTVSFFLSTNLAEVFAVLFATLFLWNYHFLTSTQLLWINLITDSLPVLALGIERTAHAMERGPVAAEEIFSGRSLLFMLVLGAVQTAIVLAVFLLALNIWGNGAASTCAFLTLSFLELFHAFNVRKERERLKLKDFTANPAMIVTVLFGIFVNLLLVAVPLLRGLFSLTPLNGYAWLLVFCASILIVPCGELYKAIACRAERGAKRHKKHIPAFGNTK